MTLNTTSNPPVWPPDRMLIKPDSSRVLSLFNLYPVTITSCLSFTMNTISLVIFLTGKFKSFRLFQYIHIYLINSLIICLLSSFSFIFSSHNLIHWSNTYSAQFFYNYIESPLLDLSYFYGSVLEIYIILDRIYIFVPQLYNLPKPGVYKVCLVTLLVCVIIDSPSFMSNTVQPIQLNGPNETIWLGAKTEFSYSNFGMNLLMVLHVVRTLIIFAIEMILSCLCILLLRRSIKKKIKFKARFSNRIAVFDRTTPVAGTTRQKSILKKRDESSMVCQQQMTIMVIIICLISSIEHSFVIVSYLYCKIFLLRTISSFVHPFKHLFDFFAFLYFSKRFQQSFASIFKLPVRRQIVNNSTLSI